MKYLTGSVAALGLMLATAAPLHAQSVNANNLVSVSLTNVANNLAQNLSVDVSQIPVTVQVPVGVAANICPNVDVSALAQSNKNDQQATCTADGTSQALNNIVQRNLAPAQEG